LSIFIKELRRRRENRRLKIRKEEKLEWEIIYSSLV